MKYLNSKADPTFKRVFGEHPDLAISLLNALLPLTAEQEITEIEYLPWEIVPDNPLRSRNCVVDMRCKDRNGRQFLVEIQIIWSPEFRHRIYINASKAHVCQIGRRKKQYEPLQPVYSLNLANEVFEPELEGYYHHFRTVYEENSDKIINGLQLIFVELPKFNARNYTEKKMQTLWLRYLTEIDEKTRQVPEELLANPEVKKAVTALEESAFSDAELLGYEKFWDIISVERTLYNSARRKGFAIGFEEAKAKEFEKVRQ
nr:Rpn family recombination-promoting nuclease/putative transposase [Bacteroides sp. UBA939]